MARHSLPRAARWWTALVLIALVLAALPVHAQDQQIVSRVNGDPITRSAFQARVRLVRWQYLRELDKLYELTGGNVALTPQYVENLVTNLENPDTLGDAVLTQMEEERLLAQVGRDQGIAPTDAEVQQREAAFFSLWTNVSVDELASSDSAQAFITQWYVDAGAASGMSQDDLRAVFAAEALRARLFDHVTADVPTEELAVHTRHILCSFHPDNPTDLTPPTPEERSAAENCIMNAYARLSAGEPFASVANALSNDRASAQRGGDVDWARVSTLVTGYADAVRDAELNKLIGPVETEFGLHLIEVLERKKQRLTDEEYATSRQGYFDAWLKALRAQATIERSPDWNTDIPTEPGLDALDAKVRDAVTKVTGNSTP
ncbi:MAG TPA: peptidylprolyl isomerase [Aggregatilineaceae bacterium]|jgi:parvulin-like peptidyl-prolyl isomerase|nr:peptidylprolyl isomerase [Aggregatilineaceae bacterium]